MTRTTPDAVTIRRGHAVAPDGAALGWHSVGAGPGLVVVHGAMQSAHSQLDLARLLARRHEVHLVDRRGRGMSGPYPRPAEHLRTETEDLATIMAATGARDVLGISSGALIALRAALSTPAIRRVAAFEPPLVLNDPGRLDLMARTRDELTSGDLPNAMVTAMRVAELGPSPLLRLPRPVLRFIARRMLSAKPRGAAEITEPAVRDLAYALDADFAIVAECADRLDVFGHIEASVLLVDGSRTRPYLRAAVDALTPAIPAARRVTVAGADHGVTQNRKQWGRPDRIAPALLRFFD
jgi:pimeloyl-ACP methyl ester carboxylesterase